MSGYQQEQPYRTQVNPWPVIILPILVIVLLVRSFFDFGRAIHDPNYEPRPVTARGDLAEDEKSTISLFRNVSPAMYR